MSFHDTAAVATKDVSISSRPAIAERLRLLRLASGSSSQAAFCASVGIGTTTWNNYERDLNRISLEEATKVVQRFGVTLDWIYYGDEKGLPLALATALRDLQKSAKSA